ncbi:hypothetical protein AAG906_004489 [Vitis piasezkii]
MDYLLTLDDQRVLNLGRTRRGKLPTMPSNQSVSSEGLLTGWDRLSTFSSFWVPRDLFLFASSLPTIGLLPKDLLPTRKCFTFDFDVKGLHEVVQQVVLQIESYNMDVIL